MDYNVWAMFGQPGWVSLSKLGIDVDGPRIKYDTDGTPYIFDPEA